MLTLYEMRKRKREEQPEAGPEVSDNIVKLVESTYERPNKIFKRMRWALKNKAITLQHLFLTEKHMRTFVVPFLKENPDITKVDLRGNYMGNQASEIALEISTITELDLSVNDITDAIAKGLSKNEHIKTLDLSGNNITDVGAIALGVSSARKQAFQNRKAAFLMGTDPKLGKSSSIHYAFSKSVIFDENLIDEIFKFIVPEDFKCRNE